MPKNIFVYGTLLKGLENSHRLNSSKFMGGAVTVGNFYMVSNENNGVATSSTYEPTKQLDDDVELYKYPYLMKVPVAQEQHGSQIEGEVYEIDEKVLEELDALEDHPKTYLRQTIDVLPTGNIDDAEFPTTVEGYILESQEVIDDLKANVGKGRYSIVPGNSWFAYVKK